ncbi:MAG: hypothetical protein U0271_42180 [Polyangiaceae bacterium]
MAAGSYRYELRAMSAIGRYLPVFMGVVLGGAFTLSVLYDPADIAKAAWESGADLLGLYGGFGLVALPLIFLATAIARRGCPAPVAWAEVQGNQVVVELEAPTLVATGRRTNDDDPLQAALGARARAASSRRTVRIPLAHGYAHPIDGGKVRISLAHGTGIRQGDRAVLDLPAHLAEPIVERLSIGSYDFARSSLVIGCALTSASLLVGFQIALALVAAVEQRVAHLPDASLATFSTGFTAGLVVACVGAVHAALNFVLAPARVMVGADGVSIEDQFQRRFIPYSDIANVETKTGRLLFHRRSGRAVVATVIGVDPRPVAALVATVNAHARAALAGSAVLPVATADAKVWREAIRKRIGESGYRDQVLTREALDAALTGPASSREQRVAAALALAEGGEERARVRIRVAAATVADERTRAILERVAEDEADDAYLNAALAKP